ncbi:hypothetical protein NDU88_005074 [Pleurodeles waltl]|uniref:Uncharacterized protein n=1 Tax=Pleurodeles waltl TaxID=8319 RepID=A0AAV7M9H1_PLEWA|nr:hypothetical protein NDU88_005074 [Pleurodeles waltl]
MIGWLDLRAACCVTNRKSIRWLFRTVDRLLVLEDIRGREKLDQPQAPIEKIAESIEAAEGLTKYHEAFPNLQKPSACTSIDGSVKQIGIESLENFEENGTRCNPHSEESTLKCLESGFQPAGPLHKKKCRHDEYNQISSRCKASDSDLGARSSVRFSTDDQFCEKYPSWPVVKDAQPPSYIDISCTTGSFVSKSIGMTQVHSSDVPGGSPSVIPSVHQSFPSSVPGGSSYQNVAYDSDGFIPHGNKHVSPDVNSYFIAKPEDQSREQTPAYVKDVNILGKNCHSNSSIISSSGQCSTGNVPGQSSSSLFVGSSSSIEAFSPKSPVPPGNTSDMQDLPFRTVSSGYTSPTQVSSSPSIEMNQSILSPNILKILKGNDVAAVNAILNQLADHCPQLKKVNISMLVDVLFEAGALN